MTAAAFQKSASRVLPKLVDHRDRQPQLPPAPHKTPSAVKGMGAGRTVARGVDAPNIVLQWLGRAVGPMIEEEKKRSAIFGKVPYPGMGAARIWDWHVGWFHQHAHWPGIPLPSTGPLIPLPYVSGADKTTINGQPAARCGDFGLGIWCGGYMPLNEVYLGSATVWIESARAARTLDVTDHCVALDPAASPLAKGMVVQSSGDVKIGGCPLPSMTQIAIAAAMKVVAKGGKAGASAARRAFAKTAPYFRGLSRVEQHALARFLKHVDIADGAFKRLVIDDLRKIVRTEAGRKLMNECVDNGQKLRIKPVSALYNERAYGVYKSHFGTGACVWADDTARWGSKGAPTGTSIYYTPRNVEKLGTDIGTATSDTTLVHEMSHANNMGRGRFDNTDFSDGATYKDWKNPDELQAVRAENAYRAEKGYKQRPKYWTSPKTDEYWKKTNQTYPG